MALDRPREHFSICQRDCSYVTGINFVKRPSTIDIFSSFAIWSLMRPRPEAGMNKIAHITPHFAVTCYLDPTDFAQAAALGFKAVISNLPDGESARHTPGASEAKFAAEAGLAFRHIPATKHDVFDDRIVEAMGRAMGELKGPILAHCASGLRSALAWAAAAARSQPADCVIVALKSAGFNAEPIRGELEEQQGRPHSQPVPPPLDCRCGERIAPA